MTMTKTEEQVVKHLQQARSMELALVRTLQAHAGMTPDGAYRTLLQRHLRETRAHAARIGRRLGDLRQSPGLRDVGLDLAQRLLGQALALGKAPLDLTRGESHEEKLLRNARDECASEALEIATYDALEQLARLAGDELTVALAIEHRADEERMLADLRAQLPALAAGVAGAAGPVAGETRVANPELNEPPLPGYDALNVEEVVTRLERLGAHEVERVEAYERAHKARRGVLEAIERREQELVG